ncbi:MAG: hypothetical protein ACYTBJ_00445 [Planctomycetota bacterium]|jgi:hypothetical protein
MKAYTWDQLGRVYNRAVVQFDNLEFARELPKQFVIRGFVAGFPPEVRLAAGLAMSVIKWSAPYFNGDHAEFPILCGACQAIWVADKDCSNCCLYNPWGCRGSGSSREEVHTLILEKYREEYAKLPSEWREE